MKKYKMNLERVDEESQGSEDALDEMVVNLLMKLRKYNEAKKILDKIDVPVYREDLSPEIKLFTAYTN